MANSDLQHFAARAVEEAATTSHAKWHHTHPASAHESRELRRRRVRALPSEHNDRLQSNLRATRRITSIAPVRLSKLALHWFAYEPRTKNTHTNHVFQLRSCLTSNAHLHTSCDFHYPVCNYGFNSALRCLDNPNNCIRTAIRSYNPSPVCRTASNHIRGVHSNISNNIINNERTTSSSPSPKFTISVRKLIIGATHLLVFTNIIVITPTTSIITVLLITTTLSTIIIHATLSLNNCCINKQKRSKFRISSSQ